MNECLLLYFESRGLFFVQRFKNTRRRITLFCTKSFGVCFNQTQKENMAQKPTATLTLNAVQAYM